MKHVFAHTLFSILMLACPFWLPGQDFADLVKAGDRLYNQGKYGDAAEMYDKAWHVNTSKRNLIFKAGECYYWVKDYRKAAECYQHVKRDNEEFDLVGLKYARALKQDGRYREAMEEFKWFARDYKGPGKDMLDKIIVNDIKGCELGIELATNRKLKDWPVELQLLPEWVNSPENEFAPVPFTDDLLYFSSMLGGRAKLFRTNRQDGQWTTPIEPQGLPEITAEHFGNGSFSPDGSRFYFTQCSAVNPELVGGNGLRAHCEVYVLRKNDSGKWNEPERLRDYINLPNCTNTHPFVAHDGSAEYLFFASDRPDGFGGLDLYVCQRPLETDELDFSLPQNLGDKVNTGGDEITPYFDAQNETLYFSSNGLVALGGMDVFKTIRSGGAWTKPENLGVPFNSTCDDFFFALKKSGNGGFFISNRLFGRAKTSTRNEDIFEFFPKESKFFAVGKVFDASTGRQTGDCTVSLYEKQTGEDPRLLAERYSDDGAFKFPILPERHYAIEIVKDGFQTALVDLSSQYAVPQGFDIGISLKKSGPPKKADKVEQFTPIPPQEAPQKGKNKANSMQKDVVRPKPEPVTATGKLVFKIQLEAPPSFNEADPRYDIVREKGKLTTEPAAEPNMVRVMLGDFEDKKEANDLARHMRDSGAFPQAFVVRYTDAGRQ